MVEHYDKEGFGLRVQQIYDWWCFIYHQYTPALKNFQTCINCLQLQSNQFSDLHKLPHHAVEVDLDQLLPQYYQNNLLHDSPRKHCNSKQGN